MFGKGNLHHLATTVTVAFLVALLFLPIETSAIGSQAVLASIDARSGASSVEIAIDVTRGIDTGARIGNAPFEYRLELSYPPVGSHIISTPLDDTTIIGPAEPAGQVLRVRLVTIFAILPEGPVEYVLLIVDVYSDHPVSESRGVCEPSPDPAPDPLNVHASNWQCVPWHRKR